MATLRKSILSGTSHSQFGVPIPFPQERVKERRERILEEFQKVVLFLVEEERRLLQVLKEEEEDTLGKLQESKASLDHQSRSLDLILLQLEERSHQEPLQMLQVRPEDAKVFVSLVGVA